MVVQECQLNRNNLKSRALSLSHCERNINMCVPITSWSCCSKCYSWYSRLFSPLLELFFFSYPPSSVALLAQDFVYGLKDNPATHKHISSVLCVQRICRDGRGRGVHTWGGHWEFAAMVTRLAVSNNGMWRSLLVGGEGGVADGGEQQRERR